MRYPDVDMQYTACKYTLSIHNNTNALYYTLYVQMYTSAIVI